MPLVTPLKSEKHSATTCIFPTAERFGVATAACGNFDPGVESVAGAQSIDEPTFVVLAVGPEAEVDRPAFGRAVQEAATRFADLEF